ncbi:MAG TPA: HD domain-containing protein [Patescibacteria group bacterium]|nr:HD domain-containing protein [Patescibacteria group bacterium]
MNHQPLIRKTADYVRLKLENEPTGHDWWHVERVWKMAKIIQAKEGGDLFLIELAALLHDLGDYKQHEFNEIKGSLVLHGMMDVLGLESDLQDKIIDIVSEAQYNADETIVPKTLEGKILQDADWLEALGAVGIARTFATGGRIKRIIYDPKRKPRHKLTKDDYQHKKREGTSFNYFYEKVLKLPGMMNTETAKKFAVRRLGFLKMYMEEFLKESAGEK